MARGARRVKVGATLDPELIAAVDRYVGEHSDVDRSSVIDDALRLWYARQQDEALERQLTSPRSAREKAEGRDWAAIRTSAAKRRLAGRRK